MFKLTGEEIDRLMRRLGDGKLEKPKRGNKNLPELGPCKKCGVDTNLKLLSDISGHCPVCRSQERTRTKALIGRPQDNPYAPKDPNNFVTINPDRLRELKNKYVDRDAKMANTRNRAVSEDIWKKR